MSDQKQAPAAIRIDGGKRRDLNKQRIADRMWGVVSSPRLAEEEVRASDKAEKRPTNRRAEWPLNSCGRMAGKKARSFPRSK